MPEIEPQQMMTAMMDPGNISTIKTTMHNPIFELVDIHMRQMQTLGKAILAGQGDPMLTMGAISYGALQHMKDPIQIMEVLMRSSIYMLGK